MDNGLTIERIFNAPKELVWQAWTDPEMVKQWWGPAGFTAPSIKIDLKVGGQYIFAMHGPSGTEWDKDMYSAGFFKEVVPNEKLVLTDYFSDAEGNMVSNPDKAKSGRAMEALMKMKKIDIAEIEKAFNG